MYLITFFNSRIKVNLLNGSTITSYTGMLAEVSSGYVDASIGGFSTSLERFQLVEFSQSLVSSRLSIITKTPEKSDQVSYITRKIEKKLTNDIVHSRINENKIIY